MKMVRPSLHNTFEKGWPVSVRINKSEIAFKLLKGKISNKHDIFIWGIEMVKILKISEIGAKIYPETAS